MSLQPKLGTKVTPEILRYRTSIKIIPYFSTSPVAISFYFNALLDSFTTMYTLRIMSRDLFGRIHRLISRCNPGICLQRLSKTAVWITGSKVKFEQNTFGMQLSFNIPRNECQTRYPCVNLPCLCPLFDC